MVSLSRVKEVLGETPITEEGMKEDMAYLASNFPECNAPAFPELWDPIMQACLKPTSNLLSDERATIIIRKYSKLFF